jgi:hypothetical protein
MQELVLARALIEQGLKRLQAQPSDHPLRQLEPARLRRLLAEAAFRELRDLRREIMEDSSTTQ